MKEEYTVYEERSKLVMASLVFLLFAGGLVTLIIKNEVNIFLKGLIVVFIVLLLMNAVSNLFKASQHKVFYKLSTLGVYDYTKNEEPIVLHWDEIKKIELIPNNTSLQIGILAIRTIENKQLMGQNLKENLIKNGNFAFYSVIIDGFMFRRKKFKEIFVELKKYASFYNDEALIIDYKDPFK